MERDAHSREMPGVPELLLSLLMVVWEAWGASFSCCHSHVFGDYHVEVLFCRHTELLVMFTWPHATAYSLVILAWNSRW